MTGMAHRPDGGVCGLCGPSGSTINKGELIMAGKHRPPRPCWRQRVHRLNEAMGHSVHELGAIVALHVAGITAYETTIKHALSTIVHIGH